MNVAYNSNNNGIIFSAFYSLNKSILYLKHRVLMLIVIFIEDQHENRFYICFDRHGAVGNLRWNFRVRQIYAGVDRVRV